MWGNFRLNASIVVVAGGLLTVYGFHRLLPERAISHKEGVIILVRNAAVPDEPGKQVLRGVAAAARDSTRGAEALGKDRELPRCDDESAEADRHVKALRVCVVEFSLRPGEETPENLRDIARTLLRQLIREPVLGVISDGSSLTDPYIINVCQGLRIPLLLTSATDDSLLADTTNGYVFRLPANNARQAKSIADEMIRKKWFQGTDAVALLYEANRYGERLYSQVADHLGGNGRRFYGFRLTPETELALLIPRFSELSIKGIVFLGYWDTAQDLIAKLRGYGWKGRLLLADGAYSAEVGALAAQDGSIDFAIAYPVNLAESADPRQHQFGAFGADAWQLLNALRGVPAGTSGEIRQTLNNVRVQLVRKAGYSFDERGENSKGDFVCQRLGGP